MDPARENLIQAQSDLSNNRYDSSVIEKVQECTKKVIKLNEIEESILRQKPKIDWMGYGDDNSAFFYAIIKAKNKAKRMQGLIKRDGTTIKD